MKPLIQFLVAGLVCCFGSAAHATIVTYTYQAKVASIKERINPSADFVQVTQSGVAGTSVALGDIVTGSFRYDTSVGLSSYQPEQQAGSNSIMYDSGPNDYINFVDRNTGLAFSSQPSMNSSGLTEIVDGVPVPGAFASDMFAMLLGSMNDTMFASANIWLHDLHGNAFQGTAIPTELKLSAFQFASVEGSFLRSSDDAFMYFTADFSSLERVGADVPEPGSAFLFAIAAGGMFGLRRIRRLSRS